MIGNRRRDLTHALKACRLKFVDAFGKNKKKSRPLVYSRHVSVMISSFTFQAAFPFRAAR